MSYNEKILEQFEMQQAKGVDILMIRQNALVHTKKEYQANSSTII